MNHSKNSVLLAFLLSAQPYFMTAQPQSTDKNPEQTAEQKRKAEDQKNNIAKLFRYMSEKDLKIAIARIEKLLSEDPSIIDAPNSKGITPLLWASGEGKIKLVKLFIAAGADVNKATPDGFTPLLLAASLGHLSVVKALVNAGADIKTASASGHTALHYAAKKGYQKIAQALIDAGANINQPSLNDGTTPLIIATTKNKFKLVELLIKNGADESIKDKNNRTALDYAKSNRKEKKFNEALLQARRLYIQ